MSPAMNGVPGSRVWMAWKVLLVAASILPGLILGTWLGAPAYDIRPPP